MNEIETRYQAWRARPDLDPAVAAELAAFAGDEVAITVRF